MSRRSRHHLSSRATKKQDDSSQPLTGVQLTNEVPTTRPRRRVLREKPQGYNAADFIVFLIPALRFIEFNIVGRLSGSDVLMIILFVCLAVAGKLKIGPPIGKKILIFCSLWLASQCVTDMVRHTAFSDYARGWSNIGLTIANFMVVFTLLYGQRRRLALFGWGMVCGVVLTVRFNPDETMQSDVWKFGYAFAMSWAVLLIASSNRCRGSVAMIMALFAGLVNVWMGSRSMGGFCLATFIYLYLTRYMRRRSKAGLKLSVGSKVAVAISIAISVYAIYSTYEYAARTGLLGDDAMVKFDKQSSGAYGILFGGRTEMFGSLPAIYDSPILGHGSWAKDPIYYFIQHRAMATLGYTDAEDVNPEAAKDGLIPSHSFILGAWVYAGILGAGFWVFVFGVTVRALGRVPSPNAILLPFAAFAAFSMLWDLLFSPYGSEMRTITPYYVVLILTSLMMKPQDAALRVVRKTSRRIAASQIKRDLGTAISGSLGREA